MVLEVGMGGFWAGLYVLGLAMPALLFLAGTLLVLQQTARLRARDALPLPRWQLVGLHLLLGFVVAAPLGPLRALGWLLVPAYLHKAARQGVAPAGASADATPASPVAGREPRGSWTLAVLIGVTGIVLPWATGLGVKLYLDSIGRPTLPIEGFLDPASLVVSLLLTLVAWAFPFLFLASAVVVPWRVGFPPGSPGRRSLLPIWLAYAAGVGAGVPLFAGVFWEFDMLMMMVPVGGALLPPMALGYLVGWWLLRRRARTA